MSTKPKMPSALSLDDIDAKFNFNVIIPAKIKTAIEKLGDSAMLSIDFARFAEVGIVQLSQFAEQFEDFQVHLKTDGRVKILWCGTKAFATKVKERLIT